MKFSDYVRQSHYNDSVANLVLVSFLSEHLNENELNEASISNFAEKLGIKISKENGLIDYIKKFTVASGKLLLAAIKGDTESVRTIAKSLKKEEFLDFLLKLDTVTLHLITGPIHMIDAITGWEIMANIQHQVKHSSEVVISSFKDALKYIKDKIENFMAPGDKKKELLNHVNIISKLTNSAMALV